MRVCIRSCVLKKAPPESGRKEDIQSPWIRIPARDERRRETQPEYAGYGNAPNNQIKGNGKKNSWAAHSSWDAQSWGEPYGEHGKMKTACLADPTDRTHAKKGNEEDIVAQITLRSRWMTWGELKSPDPQELIFGNLHFATRDSSLTASYMYFSPNGVKITARSAF